MPQNFRIQKLLFSEYCDFEERVLIESPFAQIFRDGHGVKQIQMAVTPTSLIIASDVVKSAKEYTVFFNQADPDTETMELISIYPIDYVSLSVFQRRRRKVLKLRLHDGSPYTQPRISYMELGGHLDQRVAWPLWCERIEFMKESLDSCTEASVASSTSVSSVASVYRKCTKKRIWEHYNRPLRALVDAREDLTTIYTAKPNQWLVESVPYLSPRAVKVNRFGEGVSERCSNGLYLSSNSSSSQVGQDKDVSRKMNKSPMEKFHRDCVGLWRRRTHLPRSRRKRFLPCPDLNHFAGIISTDLAGRCSLQMRRSRSQIRVREEIPKALNSSQSLEEFVSYQTHSSGDHVLYFWTTDYWYKPDEVTRNISSKPRKPSLSRVRSFFGRKRSKPSAFITDKIKTMLEIDDHVCMWEVESSILASQLTIIDSQLFLRVPLKELSLMKKEGHARNCRNFLTWMAFSQRVTCLTVSQILLLPETKGRARLIARYIMVSEKCHQLGNQQSALSILNALQTPAIFRLYATWAHVRQHHATCYRKLKWLIKFYDNPDLPDVTKPPFLVGAKFYLDAVFGRWVLPEKPVGNFHTEKNIAPNPLLDTVSLPIDKKDGNLLNFKHHMKSIFSFGSERNDVDGSETSDMPPYMHPGEQTSMSDVTSCSSVGFQSATEILKTTREAAKKYDLCANQKAQEFLLKVPYLELHASFRLSLKIEPPS